METGSKTCSEGKKEKHSPVSQGGKQQPTAWLRKGQPEGEGKLWVAVVVDQVKSQDREEKEQETEGKNMWPLRNPGEGGSQEPPWGPSGTQSVEAGAPSPVQIPLGYGALLLPQPSWRSQVMPVSLIYLFSKISLF